MTDRYEKIRKALADDDEWLKAQAAYRADTVTRQALIEKLEDQESAA